MRSQTLHREMQEAEGRMGPDCILQLSQKKKGVSVSLGAEKKSVRTIVWFDVGETAKPPLMLEVYLGKIGHEEGLLSV